MKSAPLSRNLLGRTLLALSLAVGGVPLASAPRSAHGQAEAPAGLPKFDDVTKGMQPIGGQGFMTFYRNDDKDPSKDHTRLLAVIPKSLLGQDLLMANSVSRGAEFGSNLDSGILVRFEQVGNRMQLLAPDTSLKDDGNKEIQGAVRATYRPALLAGFPILSTDGQGGVLIDLSGSMYTGIGGFSIPAQMVRRDLSRIMKVKSFPENVLIDLDIAYGGAGDIQTIGISYSFRKLPALGSYTPRLSDERVGYFTTDRQDWTTKYTERDNIVRYVNRWNIKKQDPSLELSPPEKPVVFILEKNIPIQFRKYVADGILEWNKAYEKVGITGAIVVQQQTDDNEFKDIDPEDARYNFIRWIVTGNAFARGPSRPDPRTGQLLDADIVFDDSMVRYAAESADILGPKALSADMGKSVLNFFRDNPAFLPAGAELSSEDRELLRPVGPSPTENGSGHGTPVDRRNTQTLNLGQTDRARFNFAHGSGPSTDFCSIGQGIRHQLMLGQLAALAGGKAKLPERLVGQYIKEVTTHEVGHTIGLRHNFKASAWLTVDEIKKRRDTTDEPTSSSVMDYNPMLFFAGDKIAELRNICTNVIGPYDYWAVEYGYAPAPAGKSEAEHLAAIAGKNTARELSYASDEDNSFFQSPDPSINLFDAGSSQVDWSKSRIALADELLKNVKDWTGKDDPNFVLREIFSTLTFERIRAIPFAARAVTGQYMSRARPGDAEGAAAFTLLDPKEQRAALKFLTDTIFAETFFDVDPEFYNRLGIPRYWDKWSTLPSRADFPVHSFVLSRQTMSLAALTNGSALVRVYDAEKKSKAEDKFTAAELIVSVRDAIWADALSGAGKGTDSKPMISSFRRNLQQQYLQNTLSIAELKLGAPVPPDLQNMVRYSLRELSGKLGKVLENKDRIDFASRAHLSEAKTRIDRVLDAPFVGANMGGGTTIIISGQPAAQSTPEVP